MVARNSSLTIPEHGRRVRLGLAHSARTRILSAVGQFILARIPRHNQGWARHVTRRALGGVRRIGDPSVTYAIGAGRLAMPLSHDLPLHRAAYPGYSANLGRIAASLAMRSDDFAVIDVGANVGDSLALMRAVGDFPILCIEPEPTYFRYLEANARQFKNVELLQLALGEETSQESAALVANRGTAALDPVAAGYVPLTTLDRLIELRPSFARARMVKVDTDGSDLSVIRGGASFLRRIRPVLFFEYDPTFFSWDEAEETIDLLARSGYRTMLFWDNAGDFLIRLNTNEREKLRDLTQYYSGRASSRYCDVAVFAAADEAVSDAIRCWELTYREARRRGGSARFATIELDDAGS